MFRIRRTPTVDDTEAAAETNGSGTASPAAANPAITAGKGRPTPKRSEAERRRQPFTAPKDRKEAGRQYRDRDRADRNRRMDAMRRGEDWALTARDRGPVRALARDYVDAHRRISEYYMYGLLVLMATLFMHSAAVQSAVLIVVVCAAVIMLSEGVFIARRLRKLAAERLPGQSTRGVGLYAAMRALQIRQLRVPKPRVKPGDAY